MTEIIDNGENTNGGALQRTNEVKKDAGKDIMGSLNTSLMEQIKDLLEKELNDVCDIVPTKVNSYEKFHLNRKGAQKKPSLPEGSIIFNSDEKANPEKKFRIQIDPYNNYEYLSFTGENYTFQDLLKEIGNIKTYFSTGTLPENSNLTRIEYPNPDTFDVVESGLCPKEQLGNFTQEGHNEAYKKGGSKGISAYAEAMEKTVPKKE